MEACLNCVYKHLAQAMIIHTEECNNGYPNHIHRVIGHLAEASREIVAYSQDLAIEIRSQRIRVMGDPRYMPPYEGLLDYIVALIAADTAKLPRPAIPLEIRAHPEEYEDTRLAVPVLTGYSINVIQNPSLPPYTTKLNSSDSHSK